MSFLIIGAEILNLLCVQANARDYCLSRARVMDAVRSEYVIRSSKVKQVCHTPHLASSVPLCIYALLPPRDR